MTSSKGEESPPLEGGHERQQCIDCGLVAPQTETNFTLIGQRHGWRLTRSVDTNGRRLLEWRCPKCFARHRDRAAAKR